MTKLTTLETAVLALLVADADGNGGDFGTVETVNVKSLGISRKALGGVLTSLSTKGIITVHEPVETNGGPSRGGERWTQFTLAEAS